MESNGGRFDLTLGTAIARVIFIDWKILNSRFVTPKS